jgi:hypothetical protein
MKKNILNIKGVSAISKEAQSQINGGFGYDLSKCGCDCTGSVIGPFYCGFLIQCPQVYTCDDK